MVSLKDALTKDARPIKTMPARRPGLASGYCTSISSLCAIAALIVLKVFEIDLSMLIIVTIVVGERLLSTAIFHSWVAYSQKHEQQSSLTK